MHKKLKSGNFQGSGFKRLTAVLEEDANDTICCPSTFGKEYGIQEEDRSEAILNQRYKLHKYSRQIKGTIRTGYIWLTLHTALGIVALRPAGWYPKKQPRL